jgi:UDP-N-acetylmuramoyl-tripeptide--D-alanyl-D-alanine ligase
VGEGARGIRDGANREGSWGDEVVLVDDLENARLFLEHELRPGDVVLVKSSYGAGLWQLGDLLVEGGDAA